jgi:GT2 family glycosyltransferase
MDGRPMNIAVIIVNWNGKKDTLECLESFKKVCFSTYELIVVDNGSSDDSAEEIRKFFPEITLLKTGENLGFSGGNNVGIHYALTTRAEAILLLNNDTVVDAELLRAFEGGFHSDPRIGILGAKIYLFDAPEHFDHFGGNWNRKKANFDLMGHRLPDDKVTWEDAKEIDYVCGCALMARRAVFEKVGLLEPRFFLYWEESDFCYRAKKNGFKIMTCPRAKVWHKVGASIKAKSSAHYFWWRNRLLWIERNCSFWEKVRLLVTLLLPEIFKLYKLKFLKKLQLLFFSNSARKARYRYYAAATQGVEDYLFRRFGNAPPWIYTNEK